MREEKKSIVQELVNEINGANPLIFTDYSRANAIALSQLRSQLSTINSKYKVVQNTLFQRALETTGTGDYSNNITGPLAIAYGGKDVIEVVKILIKFIKDNPDTIVLKGGLVDKQYFELNGLEELAKLPSREMLLARLIGQINAPLSRFAMALKGNINKVVCALEGISKKKQDGPDKK